MLFTVDSFSLSMPFRYVIFYSDTVFHLAGACHENNFTDHCQQDADCYQVKKVTLKDKCFTW